MRIPLIAFAILVGSLGIAEANCLKETALPGSIKAKSTATRSFTLSRPGAAIGVVTDSINDRLFMKVIRPNGLVACKTKGPSSILTCEPTVGGRKRPEGVHKILVTNKLNRRIDYTLSCANPP